MQFNRRDGKLVIEVANLSLGGHARSLSRARLMNAAPVKSVHMTFYISLNSFKAYLVDSTISSPTVTDADDASRIPPPTRGGGDIKR